MKKKGRSLGIFVVLVLVLGALPLQDLQAQDAEDPTTQIDNLFTDLTEQDGFSGAVLVARGDTILLSQGYGLAIREADVPNAPDTIFRIGSMTKQFTAMAIVLLQERGLLTVDDSICMYFEDCPTAWEDITIHQLLTHTSGIHDLYLLPNYIESMTLPTTPTDMIAWFINEPLDFAPGEQWRYSPSGYVVLGYIIEEVSGDAYGTFLRQNLLDPLGMEDTGYDDSTRGAERRAAGYDGVQRSEASRAVDMSHYYAGGGLFSTVEDLYLWTEALHGGQVISEESWDIMMQSLVAVPDLGEEAYYGYGLVIVKDLEHPIIHHAGGTFGFRGMVQRFTADDVTIIILGNNVQTTPWVYVDAVAEILFDD